MLPLLGIVCSRRRTAGSILPLHRPDGRGLVAMSAGIHPESGCPGERDRHEFFFSRASPSLGEDLATPRVLSCSTPEPGPIRAELLGLERLEAQARRLAAACILAPRRRASSPLLKRFVENRGPDPRPARDPRARPPGGPRASTPTGWPTTSTSSTRCCARSARTCRAATTRSCRSSDVAAARGLSAGLRPGPGAGRPHRQRARRGADHPVRPGVPGGRAPDDRRALGLAHDAPPGPAREPPAPGRADALGLGRAPAGRALVRPGQRRTARADDRARQRRAACPSGELERPVRRPPDATPARPGAGGRRRVASPRGRARPHGARRRTRSSAASTTARPPTRSRSATACSAFACSRPWTGTPSSSGAAWSRRSSATTRRGLPAAGLRHPRPLPEGRREDRQGIGRRRARGGARRPSSWPRGRARARPAARARRLLPGRPRRGRAEARLRLPARRSGSGSSTGSLAHPGRVYFGSIALLLAAFLACSRAGRWRGEPVAWSWLPLVVLVAAPAAQRAGGGAGQPPPDPAPAAAGPAQARLQGGHPGGVRHVRRHALDAGPAAAAPRSCCERLEIHYLANPDPSLRFALLTDFADAPEEQMPEDEALLRDALERVTCAQPALRRRRARTLLPVPPPPALEPGRRAAGWAGSGSAASSRSSTGCSGATATRAIRVCSADPASLPRIRFVITLDADTQMPRDTAGRLVGTLAHPLNQPRFDPEPGGSSRATASCSRGSAST